MGVLLLRLRLLGGLVCEFDDGREITVIHTQPKRLSLLAYISAVTPVRFHRRERLLAMFWPDLDESRGRDALSSALGFLRRTLGPSVLLTRGAEEVSLNTEYVWSDILALRNALRRNDITEVMRLYRGDFLDGFHVRGSRTFEDWTAEQRLELRTLVAGAAKIHSELAEQAGDHAMAANLAQRAIALAIHDERTTRAMLLLLERIGERAGALFAYRSFADRLKRDFDADPSPHTVAVLSRLRESVL